jgi:hypothetical protein
MSKYKVAAPQDMIMFARATLLYDTLAARLDPTINFYKEHGRFAKRMSKKANKKAQKSFIRGMSKGFDGSILETVKQVAETGSELMFRAQRLMSVPYDFAVVPYTVEKWIFILMQVVYWLVRVLVITAIGTIVVAAIQLLQSQTIQWDQNLHMVLNSPVYLIVLLLVTLLSVRVIMFRLGEKIRRA